MLARPPRPRAIALLILAAGCAGALAQNVKPPKAQLWIDVSTGTMAGMPELDMAGGMGGALAGMMGGGRAGAPTPTGSRAA